MWCFEGGIAVNRITAKWKKVIYSKYADKKQQNLVDRLLFCLEGQYSCKGSVHAATCPFLSR